MADEFDPFAQDTGLKSDYDGTITDAFFALNEYGTHLQLKIMADDGEEVERRYSCGSDWMSNDGGKTVEHPAKKIFNAQAKVSELVRAAFQCGGEKELRERGGDLGPRRADIWLGTGWHWEATQKEATIQGETRQVVSVLPTAFLGVGDVSQPTAATNGQFPDALMAQAKALAAANDYPAWTDKMMALGDSVLQNPVVMSALADTAFYESLKG